jgi:hypothetical protein
MTDDIGGGFTKMVAEPHPKQDRNVRETNNKIKILL